MNVGVRQWWKEGRFGGLMAACARLFRRYTAFLEIPTPEGEQLRRRVTKMERDIILPVKAVGIGMLLYSFHHGWVGEALNAFTLASEWTRHFLWYYIPANVLVAAVLLGMRRMPLGLVQWVVFVSGLLDTILFSALAVLTGGHQSFLYWLFLALIVRSAVSVPRATSQLALHFTIIVCYLMAGVIQLSIAQTVATRLEAEEVIQRTSRDLERKGAAVGPRGRESSRRKVSRGLPPAIDPVLLSATSAPSLAAGSVTQSQAIVQPASASNPVSGSLPRPASAVRPTSSRPASTTNTTPASGSSDDALAENPWFAASSESPAEPLLVRLALLILMSVCSYGVQVLLERQRKAEEEAREFAMREGQLHAAGRLAAEFAHQIKNPLAIINNAVFSLQRALNQGRSVSPEQIRIIEEEVERSDRIITQIMGYAQLSEGRVERLNVIEELDAAIARVFPPAAGYPVQVHRDYGPEFPPLLMLRRHVSETFINLLQNAREALGSQGGNVYVAARCHTDYSVEVSIGDDGPGIPPDKRERIFEAYYTTKEKGTGLGLATVKHNVELYGGSVRVESELGKGARFILIFSAKTLLKLAKET